MLTLHAHVNRRSPPTFKLRLALAEAGAAYDYRPVDLDAGEQKRPEFLSLNPHGKIPVLVDGDFVLAESDAILFYIAEAFPAARLLPPAGDGSAVARQARARALQWCGFASTGLYQAYLDVYIHKVVGAPDKQVSWIGELSIADLGAAAVLQAVKLRLPGEPLAGRAALAGWYARVSDRPSWRRAQPEAQS
jgi:glutathione S-transferase